MFKSDIRTIFKDMRNDLTIKDINYLSQKIRLSLFTNFNFNNIESVHIFLPMLLRGEVNTWVIIEQLNKFFKEISIIVPKIKNDILKNYYIDKNTTYKRDSYGILEPATAKPYTENHFDMIIVPLLACDNNGNRVGYGKGYYDHLLNNYSANHIVGVSYFNPIYEIKDVNNYDVKLDYCVTPSKIYKFG